VSFHCTSCGLCCQSIALTLVNAHMLSPWMQQMVADFPYEAKADGSCEKLVDNKCSVYEDRPLFCNVERIADEVDMPMSKNEWFELNYQGCAILQREEAA